MLKKLDYLDRYKTNRVFYLDKVVAFLPDDAVGKLVEFFDQFYLFEASSDDAVQYGIP